MHKEQRQWLKTDTIVPTKVFHKELIIWQNRFEWFLYLRSNLLARLSWISLGNSKQKNDWQHLTRSILPVWNSFIKNLFTTKSGEFKSVFLNGQASRPYSKIGIHLVNIRCKTTSSEAILPTLPHLCQLFSRHDVGHEALKKVCYCDITFLLR